jgi:hypothetical protein
MNKKEIDKKKWYLYFLVVICFILFKLYYYLIDIKLFIRKYFYSIYII